MTSIGKARAMQLVSSLWAEGMTNLWDGIEKGLDVLKNGSGNAGNGAMLLFTDGVSNIEPPRGYIQMLERYRTRNRGQLPGTITTFGFGYSLDRWVPSTNTEIFTVT